MRTTTVLSALILFVSVSIGRAQTVGANYPIAEQAFDQSSIPDRMTLQLMLTSAGYWNAVPNVSFSRRLYSAIAQFQADNGYPTSGILDEGMIERLAANAAPYLKMWGFRQIPHPYRGHPIWVPLGLGLQAERNQNGLLWREPRDRVRLSYQYFPNTALATGFDALAAKILEDGGQIYFRTMKPDFFVISSSTNGIDSYVRYQWDGDGILGFSLTWMNQETDLHIERVATLISGSFWSSMTGAPFANIPAATPSDTFAVARPPQPEPTPQSSAPATQPPVVPTPKPQESKGEASGTGFFVNADGDLLTNAHVVDGCSTITVTSEPGTSASGQVIARDIANDLAVLKTTLKPAKIAALRSSVRLGENVEAFGFPLANLLSSSGNFTLGNVTALSGIGDDSRFLQISTPVQPGNSGGPLLDQSGNVVGIVSAKLNVLKIMVATNGDIPQNVNFAIKGNVAATFLESNRISTTFETASTQMGAPDIADVARRMSAFIQCQMP